MNYKLSEFFNKKNIIKNGSFSKLDNIDSKYKNVLSYCDTFKFVGIANNNKNIKCIITNKKLKDFFNKDKSLIISGSPRKEFYKLHQTSHLMKTSYSSKKIGKKCIIHESAIVHPNTIIGNNVKISKNVVINSNVTIKDNCVIESGTVLGGDSILFYINNNNRKIKIEHSGGVFISSNTLILSNSIICKAIFSHKSTYVGSNCIIGAGVYIGHECKINNNVVVSHNSTLARCILIGKNSFIGIGSSIKEYVNIGENVKVMMGSVVIKDIPSDVEVSGNFASEHKERMRKFIKKNK